MLTLIFSGGIIKFAQKQSHDQRYSAGGSGYGTDGFEAVYDLIDKACRNLAAKIQENLASSAL